MITDQSFKRDNWNEIDLMRRTIEYSRWKGGRWAQKWGVGDRNIERIKRIKEIPWASCPRASWPNPELNHQGMINWIVWKQIVFGFVKRVLKPFSPQHDRKHNMVWGSSRRAWDAKTPALRTPKNRHVPNAKRRRSYRSDCVTFSDFECDEIELVNGCQWHMRTRYSKRTVRRESHINVSRMTWLSEKSSSKLSGKPIIKAQLDHQ